MGRHKKYLTEEERKEAHRKANAKWKTNNPEARKKSCAKWRAKNPDYRKGYYEKNKEKETEQHKEYRQKNEEKYAAYSKKWRDNNLEAYKVKNRKAAAKWREKQENKEKQAVHQREYNKTPIGRARYLVNAYKQKDRKTERGVCTLTSRWMVDNIFADRCLYCGESDWKKLGCDRIDNDLPHTIDNVVCCCTKCNSERGTKTFEEFLRIKGIDKSEIKKYTQ